MDRVVKRSRVKRISNTQEVLRRWLGPKQQLVLTERYGVDPYIPTLPDFVLGPEEGYLQDWVQLVVKETLDGEPVNGEEYYVCLGYCVLYLLKNCPFRIVDLAKFIESVARTIVRLHQHHYPHCYCSANNVLRVLENV